MKKSVVGLFAGVVFAAFVLAGCSFFFPEESDPTIIIKNLTGTSITAIYIDPYERDAIQPTGQSKIPSGKYLPDNHYIEYEVDTDEYMICYMTAIDGSWLEDVQGNHQLFDLDPDIVATLEIYSDNWIMYIQSRSAERTVIASGTLKAM